MYDLSDTLPDTMTYEKFVVESGTRMRIPVKRYRISSVEIKNSEATVELELSVTLATGSDATNVVEERWRLTRDGWRKVYVPIQTPFDLWNKARASLRQADEARQFESEKKGPAMCQPHASFSDRYPRQQVRDATL